MIIQIDSREKARAITKIVAEFDRQNITHPVSKLMVGDYMNYDNPRLIIDRKQNLSELCNNVCNDHDRFRRELILAQKNEIQLVILVEHGKGITCCRTWHGGIIPADGRDSEIGSLESGRMSKQRL